MTAVVVTPLADAFRSSTRSSEHGSGGSAPRGPPDGDPSGRWHRARARGIACTGFAMGDQASDVFRECIRELTVANQRGICMDVDDCFVDPDHRTACDELND